MTRVSQFWDQIRDLGFLRGHQGHRPPDEDNEEDNEVEDNNKEENNKDDNDDKGISALVLQSTMRKMTSQDLQVSIFYFI